MLVIEILLLTLQVVEFCMWKFEQRHYVKVTKRQVEVKVRSEFPDSDGDDYDKMMAGTRQNSKPKAIKSIRHLKQYIARL